MKVMTMLPKSESLSYFSSQSFIIELEINYKYYPFYLNLFFICAE